MQISKISFKGYTEIKKLPKNPDKTVVRAFKNARPFLRQIGYSMPDHRDLVINLTTKKGSFNSNYTIMNAYDYNKETGITNLLAQADEHNITEYGLDFVRDVFLGLRKHNEQEFKNIAADFVTKLDFAMWEQHPSPPSPPSAWIDN